MKKRPLIITITSVLAIGYAAVIGGFIAKSNNNDGGYIEKAEAAYNPGTTYNVSDTAAELDSYYSSISNSATGDTLLSALRTLNSTKRKKTVGYSTMGTSTSGAFVYTDYDLNNTATDSKGQKYGTKVASFYTKTSTTSWNREHTWPNSHGGNLIENDILMTRPTITSENSNRGNSFYVEGKCDGSNGWDPKTAGYAEWCRGECARIILYGVVADSNLSLIDADYHATSNNNRDNLMGNINTLIKWHFNYSPNQYEINRNNGGEYLQGNRNPFVDHPEYVARIWSSFNNTVSTICSQKSSMYNNWVPGSYSTYGTNDAVNGGGTNTDSVTISVENKTMKDGETATISATSSNNSQISWSSSNTGVVTVSSATAASGANVTLTAVGSGTATITAQATINGNVLSQQCVVTVSGQVAPVKFAQSELHLELKETSYLVATTNDNSQFTYSFDEMAYKVLNFSAKTTYESGEKLKITALANGTTTITVTATNGGTATCVVTVGTGQYVEPSKPKSGDRNKNLPLIIGLGAGGGTIVLAGLIVLIVLLVRKRTINVNVKVEK